MDSKPDAAALVDRVGGEDGELGGEAAIVHFQDGFDGVGDFFAADFIAVGFTDLSGGAIDRTAPYFSVFLFKLFQRR
ncbi:MAG: hypothetical protein M3N41_13055 [Acidobacteriota bacterium]|nr:hypothetical protein [Acidobacteriota bacterium]